MRVFQGLVINGISFSIGTFQVKELTSVENCDRKRPLLGTALELVAWFSYLKGELPLTDKDIGSCECELAFWNIARQALASDYRSCRYVGVAYHYACFTRRRVMILR